MEYEVFRSDAPVQHESAIGGFGLNEISSWRKACRIRTVMLASNLEHGRLEGIATALEFKTDDG
jgi:hypothetical protein